MSTTDTLTIHRWFGHKDQAQRMADYHTADTGDHTWVVLDTRPSGLGFGVVVGPVIDLDPFDHLIEVPAPGPLADLLDREVLGRYDLDPAYYTPDDLFREIVVPNEGLFSGQSQRDLTAAIGVWMTYTRATIPTPGPRCNCAERFNNPADPCGHGDTSEGCPVHDPNYYDDSED